MDNLIKIGGEIQELLEGEDSAIGTVTDVANILLKKPSRKIRKLTRKIADNPEPIAEEIVRTNAFQKKAREISNSVLNRGKMEKIASDVVYDEDQEKKKRFGRRIHSLKNYKLVNDLEAIRSAPLLAEKYDPMIMPFLRFNIESEQFVLQTNAGNFSLGREVTMSHLRETIFQLRSEIGNIIFESSQDAVLDYELFD